MCLTRADGGGDKATPGSYLWEPMMCESSGWGKGEAGRSVGAGLVIAGLVAYLRKEAGTRAGGGLQGPECPGKTDLGVFDIRCSGASAAPSSHMVSTSA